MRTRQLGFDNDLQRVQSADFYGISEFHDNENIPFPRVSGRMNRGLTKWIAAMTIYSYSMPKLYSDAEAADRLGISVATVRRMRVRGELGYLSIGRRVFVAEDQLKDLLRRGRRDFTASAHDASGDGLLTAEAASPYGARRSKLDSTFDRSSDDLKHAYENAETQDTIDGHDLAYWLPPDDDLPPVKPKRR